MNQTLGTLVSAQTPHRTGITAGLKRMIFTTSSRWTSGTLRREGNPTRLLAYSFRPNVAFQHGFDLDRLRKLGDEIGAIGFQIEYPEGADEAWRVSFESCADESGQVQYVSRSFLLEMKKKDPTKAG